MTAAERGVLLLCTPLDAGEQTLTMAQFRELSLRAQAQGAPEGELTRELRQTDIRRLGYDEADAARIVSLLAPERERALSAYLQRAEQQNIVPLTRISAAYPTQLARRLRVSCPPVLYCSGEMLLLQRACIALVGSRALTARGRAFAEQVGRMCADEGFVLVSGGAEGADTAAQEACLATGGSVIVFTAGRLCDCKARERVLYVSESGWQLPFSVPRAMLRNRLIHAMGEKTLVAQTGFGSGGTWNGTLDNLRHDWSPVFVCDDGSAGAQALIARGAEPTDLSQPLAQLSPRQQSLF